MNITLLENHWYDATFSPSARFGGEGNEDGHDHEREDEDATLTPREGEERREGEPEGSTARRLAMVATVPMIVVGVAVGVAVARRIQARRAARADELRGIEIDAVQYANDIAE